MARDRVVIELEAWSGPWDDDDRDANFKSEIAAYARLDPLATIRNLSANIDVPVGALVHYVLARWATMGSEGLLHLGPAMVERMWAVVERAEAADGDEARLAAFDELAQMVSWLRLPLQEPAGYEEQ